VRIARLDHLVLTVWNVAETVAFYERVLGMRHETFADGRSALHFGDQKLNLHQAGQEFDPKAAHPTPGSADLCFITSTAIADIVEHLDHHGVALEEGPVTRTGAQGPVESVYFRDPDGNLLELSNYL
jgi:catechol 2,3-dioxygenase-like lactoylglutathione lyase family enzyme